jgi:hypothetical protein
MMTRPEDVRCIEAMAIAMAEYDKVSDEKTWRDLASVAYNAMMRQTLTMHMERYGSAQLQQHLYQH